MALIDGLEIAPKKLSPEGWDYDQSVQKMRRLILSFKTVSVEILEELYRARKAMSKPGARTDLVTNVTRTWTGYLEDIGLDRMTVHRWLSKYLPEERRKKTTEEIEDQRRRIREAQERFRQHQATEPEPEQPQSSRTVDELLEEADRTINRQQAVNGKLKLDGRVENLAQEHIFSEIDRYVYSFTTTSRKLEAAHNLIKRLKDIVSILQRETINPGGRT